MTAPTRSNEASRTAVVVRFVALDDPLENIH